jgi:hypothetical protein
VNLLIEIASRPADFAILLNLLDVAWKVAYLITPIFVELMSQDYRICAVFASVGFIACKLLLGMTFFARTYTLGLTLLFVTAALVVAFMFKVPTDRSSTPPKQSSIGNGNGHSNGAVTHRVEVQPTSKNGHTNGNATTNKNEVLGFWASVRINLLSHPIVLTLLLAGLCGPSNDLAPIVKHRCVINLFINIDDCCCCC